MTKTIVSSAHPITLVGAGDASPEDLHKALKLAPLCVAVDGGLGLARVAGVDVAAAVGDFDSADPDDLKALPKGVQHYVSEQDSTDFEKALTRLQAPVVIGVGFLGGRTDHELAAFHTLLLCQERPCILLGRSEVICLAPPHLSLPTKAGDTLSLFPLVPVTGRSSSLRWPIDGIDFAPDARIGTSNVAEGPVTLTMHQPGMLLILPRALMPALLSALASPQVARWPARAR
ncbi:MAG: thiamine diphosphokinase [Pseudomonadota bacterium]